MDYQEVKDSQVMLYLLANADWVCEVCGDYNSDCCKEHIEWKQGRCDVCFNETTVTEKYSYDCLRKGINHACSKHVDCLYLYEKEQFEAMQEEMERKEWEKINYCDVGKYKEMCKKKAREELLKKLGNIN